VNCRDCNCSTFGNCGGVVVGCFQWKWTCGGVVVGCSKWKWTTTTFDPAVLPGVPNFIRNLRGLEFSNVESQAVKIPVQEYSEASRLRRSIRLLKLILKLLTRATNLLCMESNFAEHVQKSQTSIKYEPTYKSLFLLWRGRMKFSNLGVVHCAREFETWRCCMMCLNKMSQNGYWERTQKGKQVSCTYATQKWLIPFPLHANYTSRLNYVLSMEIYVVMSIVQLVYINYYMYPLEKIVDCECCNVDCNKIAHTRNV